LCEFYVASLLVEQQVSVCHTDERILFIIVSSVSLQKYNDSNVVFVQNLHFGREILHQPRLDQCEFRMPIEYCTPVGLSSGSLNEQSRISYQNIQEVQVLRIGRF
jgi:hypothetical protein